jgi:hypothetical protein
LNASLIAFALLATAALALAACGGGEEAKLLPGTTASQINANLDQVRTLVSAEDCIGAENAAAIVSEEIDALEGVDAKLKQALREGAERLNVVVGECEEGAALEEEGQALEAEEAEREAEEQEEKGKKPPKHKPAKEVEEEVPSEKEEGPTLPPNSNGKGEEQGKGKGPPVEPGGGETGSGGIGPGAPAGEG